MHFGSSSPFQRLCLAAVVLSFASGSAIAQSRGLASGRKGEFLQQYDRYRKTLVESLDEIADECEREGFTVAANDIRRLAEPVDRDQLLAKSLPVTGQPAISLDLPAAERKWRVALKNARTRYARSLFGLSKRVLKDGYTSYAYELVREAARYDPDLTTARHLLGYRRRGDRWVTEFTAEMLDDGMVWHDRFGWLPKRHVDRYEKGLRPHPDSRSDEWIPADREAEIRRDFRYAWVVTTEHFLVKTNHSLERGVEIAALLEQYQAFFKQTFAAFFNSPEQLELKFRAITPRRNRSRTKSRPRSADRKHIFHYYATKEEYVERVAKRLASENGQENRPASSAPDVAGTKGFYYPPDLTSYFYHTEEEDNTPIIYHEATHQIFYEAMGEHNYVGEFRDFWVIEGIACYMESFRPGGKPPVIGDPNYLRFRAARYRLLKSDYYIPLVEFSAMGRLEFQSGQEISKHYSQASGLAHFFMHYRDGQYRDALIEHLSQHYSRAGDGGRAVDSLAKLTGVSEAELDRQYRDYQTKIARGDDPNVRLAE